MKVVISCDELVERSYVTSVVEELLTVFKEAQIYTLVHKQGGILGPVETRKIHSSYLTSLLRDSFSKGAKWAEELWKKSYTIPSAAKGLAIPCSTDLVINVSSGLSQGIARCEGVYQVTYMIEDRLRDRHPRGFVEKIFRSYLKSWASKMTKQAHEVWTTEDLLPFVKLGDYPLFPAAQVKMFPRDFITIGAQDVSIQEARELISFFTKNNIKFKFIGSDSHLDELKNDEGDGRFFGHRCSGELAPMLSASRAHLTFKKNSFPDQAICNLSCGIPVIYFADSGIGHYFKEETSFAITELSDVMSLWDKLLETPREKCHGHAKKFHEVKFKAEVKRRVDKIAAEKLPEVRSRC